MFFSERATQFEQTTASIDLNPFHQAPSIITHNNDLKSAIKFRDHIQKILNTLTGPRISHLLSITMSSGYARVIFFS